MSDGTQSLEKSEPNPSDPSVDGQPGIVTIGMSSGNKRTAFLLRHGDFRHHVTLWTDEGTGLFKHEPTGTKGNFNLQADGTLYTDWGALDGSSYGISHAKTDGSAVGQVCQAEGAADLHWKTAGDGRYVETDPPEHACQARACPLREGR